MMPQRKTEEIYVDELAILVRRKSKVEITLTVDPSQKGQLAVYVTLPLSDDKEYERQAKALHCAPDNPEDRTITLRYRVALDFEAICRDLIGTVSQLYRSTDQPEKNPVAYDVAKALKDDRISPLHEADARAAFLSLARAGQNLFFQLFENIVAFDEPTLASDWDLFKRVIRSVLQEPRQIVVKSGRSLLPWALLYDHPDLTQKPLDRYAAMRVDFERGFWGFKHQIQEMVEGVSHHVQVVRPPDLVAAVCPQEDREGHHRVEFDKLSAQDSARVRYVDRDQLLNLLQGAFEHQCLYFFGHARQEDPPGPVSSTLILKDREISVADITAGGRYAPSRSPTIAFLNGCDTMPLRIWSKSSMAGYLCLEAPGHMCLLTTIAEVPASFGREFGVRFWRRFFEGATVGEALLEARLRLLHEYNSPLGLLYCLLGKSDAKLI